MGSAIFQKLFCSFGIKIMKQYIQYHKVWEHGNPLGFAQPKAFTKDIPQKQGYAFSAVGSEARVWLIYRESPSSDKYYLAYTFNAAEFCLDDGKIVVLSAPGKAEVFVPPVALSSRTHPWFAEFLKRHGNFAFGFMPLSEEGISNLEAVRSASAFVLR